MALFPCAFKGHRYAGKQQSAYLTCSEGTAISTVKARLCPQHLRFVYDTARGLMDSIADEPNARFTCRQCGDTARVMVSLRIFPLNSEEIQLVADLCEKHLLELHLALEATRWTAMAD